MRFQRIVLQFSLDAGKQNKYIHFEKGCEPDGLSVQTKPVPALLVKVFATAINRADILQSRGMYPAPPGESDILGLEVSGTVEFRANDFTSKWRIGDRVMALLAETHFKDNPGLSMMNESDEEVHYGSETESVGMTRVRSVNDSN